MKEKFIAGAAALALTGCASIIEGGGPQAITIASTPKDAIISIVDKQGNEISHGTSPMSVALRKSDGYFSSAKYTVTVKKDGYKDSTVIIDGHVNGWYVGGNLLVGGLIGYLIVDPATGAMWTLAPDTVNATLQSLIDPSEGSASTVPLAPAESAAPSERRATDSTS